MAAVETPPTTCGVGSHVGGGGRGIGSRENERRTTSQKRNTVSVEMWQRGKKISEKERPLVKKKCVKGKGVVARKEVSCQNKISRKERPLSKRSPGALLPGPLARSTLPGAIFYFYKANMD